MDHSTAHLGVSVYVRVAGSKRLGVEPFPQPPEGLLDPSTGGGRHHPDLLPPTRGRPRVSHRPPWALRWIT